MGNVMQASMSLDGYIADPSDRVGPLFDWYGNGEVEFTLLAQAQVDLGDAEGILQHVHAACLAS